MRPPTDREMVAIARLRAVETDLRLDCLLDHEMTGVLDEALDRLRAGQRRPPQAAEMTVDAILREVHEELADTVAYLALLPEDVDRHKVRDCIIDVLQLAWRIRRTLREETQEEENNA